MVVTNLSYNILLYMEQDIMNELVVKDDENIKNKIYTARGLSVMVDRDLAELYGVETKVFNQAVKRNIERFPSDFMFQLSKDEFENWIKKTTICFYRARCFYLAGLHAFSKMDIGSFDVLGRLER